MAGDCIPDGPKQTQCDASEKVRWLIRGCFTHHTGFRLLSVVGCSAICRRAASPASAQSRRRHHDFRSVPPAGIAPAHRHAPSVRASATIEAGQLHNPWPSRDGAQIAFIVGDWSRMPIHFYASGELNAVDEAQG